MKKDRATTYDLSFWFMRARSKRSCISERVRVLRDFSPKVLASCLAPHRDFAMLAALPRPVAPSMPATLEASFTFWMVLLPATAAPRAAPPTAAAEAVSAAPLETCEPLMMPAHTSGRDLTKASQNDRRADDHEDVLKLRRGRGKAFDKGDADA